MPKITNFIQTSKIFFVRLWQIAWSDERRAFQIIAVISCAVINAFVGFFYAGVPYIDGWQIILWALSVIFLAFILCSRRRIPIYFDRSWLLIGALVLVAFALRFIAADSLPAGFHVDEAGTAEFTMLHVLPPESDQTINPFRTTYDSQPILYHYILKLSMALFGYSIAGMRLSSAIAGALAVAATYFMIRAFSDKRTALFAAVIMTAYHYHIHWSRMALNNIWTTLWIPLVLALFLWGWQVKWSGGAILSGFCLGISIYFYPSAYLVVFLWLIILWKLVRQKENDRTSLLIYSGKMLAMALVVALPLIIYGITFPEQFFSRARIIFAWKPESLVILVGDQSNLWKFFWHQVTFSIGGFNAVPDQSGFYRPEIPFLIGVASLFFLFGFGWAIYKKQFMPALWILLIIIFGGILTISTPASSHYIASIPAICWLVAIPLAWLQEKGWGRWALLLLIVIVATDLLFYFGYYRIHPSPDLRLPFPVVSPYTG